MLMTSSQWSGWDSAGAALRRTGRSLRTGRMKSNSPEKLKVTSGGQVLHHVVRVHRTLTSLDPRLDLSPSLGDVHLHPVQKVRDARRAGIRLRQSRELRRQQHVLALLLQVLIQQIVRDVPVRQRHAPLRELHLILALRAKFQELLTLRRLGRVPQHHLVILVEPKPAPARRAHGVPRHDRLEKRGVVRVERIQRRPKRRRARRSKRLRRGGRRRRLPNPPGASAYPTFAAAAARRAAVLGGGGGANAARPRASASTKRADASTPAGTHAHATKSDPLVYCCVDPIEGACLPTTTPAARSSPAVPTRA